MFRIIPLSLLVAAVCLVPATGASAAGPINPTTSATSPLQATLVSAPSCVLDHQHTSFTWKLSNASTKSLTIRVWFYGIGPSTYVNKGGPSYDVDVTRSGLTQAAQQMAYWDIQLRAGESIEKTIYIESVWANPIETWDPTWGPKPTDVQRFYFSGRANVRFSTELAWLEAQPAYC